MAMMHPVVAGDHHAGLGRLHYPTLKPLQGWVGRASGNDGFPYILAARGEFPFANVQIGMIQHNNIPLKASVPATI